LITLGLVAFARSVPSLVAAFEQPCSADSCPLTPAQALAVVQLGISLHALGIIVAAYYVLFTLITTVIAGIIMWRRGNDWMALLVAAALVLYPAVGNFLVGQGIFWSLVASFIYIVEETLFYLVFVLFPNGRLVPRWMIVPVVGWVALHIAAMTGIVIPAWLTGLIYLVLYACVIGSSIYRYRRHSSAVQQQQTKWVVFAIIVVLFANIIYWQPLAFIPALQQPDSLYPVFGFLAYQLVTLAIPLAFGVAILRYRLYDIDVIIRRTLVYGSLSVILALVYVVGVIGSQAIVSSLTHASTANQPPLLIVITTLIIAALFQPLRRRIQTLIDRRFYRSKYDVARMLTTFGNALREEVDLHDLTAHLLTAIEETMHPAHVSLWLRPQKDHAQRGATETRARMSPPSMSPPSMSPPSMSPPSMSPHGEGLQTDKS
jgi:hypothetical protein